MTVLFSIMVMWVLYCNGLCPFGLALGYTIPTGLCMLLKGFFSVTISKKEN